MVMSWNGPSAPSAVDSITSTPPLGTAGIEPVITSRALAGYLALILPSSDTCSRCSVPPRTLVATRTLARLWAKTISLRLRSATGNMAFSTSGRRS